MAAGNKGKIAYAVGLDNEKLRSDAAESKRILQGIGTTAADEGQKMDDAFKRVGTSIATAMSVAAATAFAKTVIDVRGEIQSLEVSFSTLAGKVKGAALLDSLREFAVKTPMMMKDLAGGAQTMLGFGIAVEDVMPILKTIGDISMGDSLKFQSLTLAFSQATAAGRLMGQDLLQMINAGFNPLSVIAEKTGKTIGELKDEMSKGAISADMLKQAFMDAAAEGGKFHNMLENQSKGINGARSNFLGAVEDAENAMGKLIEGPFVSAMEAATEIVKHYEEIIKTLAVLIAAYGSYKAALIAIAATHKIFAIWEQVKAFIALTRSIRGAKDAMLMFNMVSKANPIGLIIGALTAAASAFLLFRDSSDEATEALKREQEEAEEFDKRISKSTGDAQSAYKSLQAEYKKCKTAHEKRTWIRESQREFKKLEIAVNDINTAENVFVKNTKLMMEGFKKRAEAGAWQSKVDDEYAKRTERILQLERQQKRIYAGAKVEGTSHQAGRYEHTNSSGAWVYTEEGAARARKALMENDTQLQEIDKRINEYETKVTNISSEMEGLLVKAGANPALTDKEKDAAAKAEVERQRLRDHQAKLNEQIKKNTESEKQAIYEGELEIRQAKINAMKDGLEKELQQHQLEYDRMKAENQKREKAMIKELEERMVMRWRQKNPLAPDQKEIEYRNSLGLGRKDLTASQQNQLEEFDKIAARRREAANKASLDNMLQDFMTYEQKRAQAAEQYDREIEQLYTHDKEGKRTGLRDGVTEGNVSEVERQKQEIIEAIDEEFAEREETYRAWMDQITGLTLEELSNVLEQAEKELEKAKAKGMTGSKLAESQAKVNHLKNEISKTTARDNLSPSNRTLKDWKELHDILEEGAKGFEEIGDAVGGAAGEFMKAAGEIASGTLAMINGIMTLTQSSASAMEGTAAAGAKAMSNVEKASVILAVVSAALQIATAIANMFNDDEEKQKEIERLQRRIDQLSWELDNAEVVRLRDTTINGLETVRNTIRDTRLELARMQYEARNMSGTFKALFGDINKDQMLLQQTAKKIADIYSNISYTANKALGKNQYEQARKDLENIAQQQILINEQIKKEQDKKKTDHSKIEEWERQIEELGNKAVEIINQMVEDIIGGASNDIAKKLSDAFFEAFRNGEDYAKAWGDEVNNIVADILKRMLVQKYLEEPLGEIFNKYKDKWFTNGTFNGIDAVINSMQGFAADLGTVGEAFKEIWETLPDSIKDMFTVTGEAERQAAQKGIATASQESVDELNGRATAIQGHTYSIMESSKLLVSNTNAILQSVMNIDRNTEGIAGRMDRMEDNVREIKNTMSDIALKGVKMK